MPPGQSCMVKRKVLRLLYRLNFFIILGQLEALNCSILVNVSDSKAATIKDGWYSTFIFHVATVLGEMALGLNIF